MEGRPGTTTSSGRVRVYDKLMVFRGSTFFFAGRSHAKIQIVPTVPLIIYGPFRYVNISARNHSTGPRTRSLPSRSLLNLDKRKRSLLFFFLFDFGKISFAKFLPPLLISLLTWFIVVSKKSFFQITVTSGKKKYYRENFRITFSGWVKLKIKLKF